MPSWKNLLPIGQSARGITRRHERFLCSWEKGIAGRLLGGQSSPPIAPRTPGTYTTIQFPRSRDYQACYSSRSLLLSLHSRAPRCHPRIYRRQRSQATRAATSLPTPPAVELLYAISGQEAEHRQSCVPLSYPLDSGLLFSLLSVTF